LSKQAGLSHGPTSKKDRGRGGIRTHGGLPHARFRVECLKPDSATLPNGSILSILFCDAQLSDAAPSSQRHSIARSEYSGRLLRNGSARHRGASQRYPSFRCRAFPSESKISEKCYNFRLARALLRAAYCVSQGRLRNYLLLTGVHRLLAPLFTIIRILFRISSPLHRHDSTKTRNSANLT
jgi:hypothetical protein